MSRQRKRPKGEPTFVAEFPIAFSPAQRRKARARFNCGTALYNAALREAINRAEVMRADPRWAKARDMPATIHGAPNPERRALFEECRIAAGFTESGVMSFGSRLRVGWLRDGVPAQEAQVLARTAFQAAERWVYRFGAGKKGRPRFKSMKGRGLRSMASKDGNGAIRVTILHDPDGEFGGLGIQWTDGFHAPLTIRDNPVHAYAVAAVQDGRALSARIVRRQIKGRDYYYAQITLDGSPLQRYEIPDGIIGLDLGPSTVAAVSDTGVTLEQFCDGLDRAEAELRREQRHLDRQHRAGSPECFDGKGRHKPGRCVWARSNRAAATALRIREAHRVKAEHRKSLHGDLVNRLLGQGRHVHVEDLSKVAWQKMFGRSVGFRAPGAFETLLIRRAVSAGGSATKINPYRARLSQTCTCGSITKKPLSQRSHSCVCGVGEQRDIWSAFLARHTSAGGAVDLGAAQLELSHRNDIGGGRGLIEPNLRAPAACPSVPEYASGRAGCPEQGYESAVIPAMSGSCA